MHTHLCQVGNITLFNANRLNNQNCIIYTNLVIMKKLYGAFRQTQVPQNSLVKSLTFLRPFLIPRFFQISQIVVCNKCADSKEHLTS